MTNLQKHYINKIESFRNENGRVPTVEELAVYIGRSINSVRIMVRNMEKKGINTGIFSFRSN